MYLAYWYPVASQSKYTFFNTHFIYQIPFILYFDVGWPTWFKWFSSKDYRCTCKIHLPIHTVYNNNRIKWSTLYDIIVIIYIGLQILNKI